MHWLPNFSFHHKSNQSQSDQKNKTKQTKPNQTNKPNQNSKLLVEKVPINEKAENA
jgi:hypothetical protein